MVRGSQPKGRVLSSKISGTIFFSKAILASLHSLHLLRQTDLQSIISSLHQNRQLRLALSLLKNSSSSISPDELERYKLRINQMQAYESFCNQEYKQAMDKYIESKCDPLKVVALYPNLLPENGKSNTVQKTTNNPPPQLSGVQLIDAYRALVPFLTYHRQEFYLHAKSGLGLAQCHFFAGIWLA